MLGGSVGILAIYLTPMGLMREAILLEIVRLGRGLIVRAMGTLQTPGSWRLLAMLSAWLRICCGSHEHTKYQV